MINASLSNIDYNDKNRSDRMDKNKDNIDIWQYFIISENTPFSICLNYIDIIICIFSSYFYAYVAAFYSHNFIYFSLQLLNCF